MIEALSQQIHGVPLWNWGLQAIAFACSYAGAELNARMRIKGFYLWMASNVALAVLHAYAGLWLLFALDLIFFRINIRGILHWAELHPDQRPKWLEATIRKRIERPLGPDAQDRRETDRRKGDRRKEPGSADRSGGPIDL